MPILDCLTVIGISVASALISEGISWLLIYRTDSYKRHTTMIESTNKKLDAMKAKQATIDSQGSLEKKMARLQDHLKQSQAAMAMTKMKSTVFHIIILVAVFNVLSSLYDGMIIAELPFAPWKFFRNMTQRSLASGTRDTACSMMFFYVVSSFGIRPSIQKLLGFTPPAGSGPGLFDLPDQSKM